MAWYNPTTWFRPASVTVRACGGRPVVVDSITGNRFCPDQLLLDPVTGDLVTPDSAARRARSRRAGRRAPSARPTRQRPAGDPFADFTVTETVQPPARPTIGAIVAAGLAPDGAGAIAGLAPDIAIFTEGGIAAGDPNRALLDRFRGILTGAPTAPTALETRREAETRRRWLVRLFVLVVILAAVALLARRGMK